MAKKSYSEKLKHPKWQKKRLQVLKRDKFICRLCKDSETTLNVHHLQYSKGEPWEIENKYLITLCEDCHYEVERMKKRYENDFNFNDVRIHKSNDWDDGSILIFISHKNDLSFSVYDSRKNFIDGFNMPYRMIQEIRRIFTKTLNHNE